MGMIAAALKHMLASGMAHDAIVAAVAEMETKLTRDEQAERRREKDRDRKRNKALRNSADGADEPPEPSSEIPRNSEVSAENAETPSPKQKVPTPLKTQPPFRGSVFTTRAREDRPTDWPPDYREQVWAAYGQGREKKVSMQALDEVKRSGKVSWAEFIAGVRLQAEHVGAQYRPSLQRFIKREKWQDEYTPAVATGPPQGQQSFRVVNGNPGGQHVNGKRVSAYRGSLAEAARDSLNEDLMRSNEGEGIHPDVSRRLSFFGRG